MKTDEDIISAFRKSLDPDLIGQLFDRYFGLVYGVCLKYLQDRQKAQDATMDIFEKLVDKLKTEDIQYFRGWLYTVSRNHCLMSLRRKDQINSSFMEFELTVHHIEEKDNLESDLNALEKCIEELKDEQKECIKSFYIKNNSYQHIAEETTLDLKKVKSHIQNGKRNLKNCLESKNVNR